jgi:hemoglobin
VTDETSLYDAAGGMPFFESLVDRFYQGVAVDQGLRPNYP